MTSETTAGAPPVPGQREKARAGVAARVLRLIDDPDASAARLARTIATDPIFAAKILRIANSTYYGLSGRVSTLPFAVSVVGFQAVRSLAVVIAAGVDDPAAAPEGFWQAAALAATGSELVAPALEADPGDAFSVGLLHTLGTALLHQQKPGAALCLPLHLDGGEDLIAAEQEEYGISHEALGSKILGTWHVPARVCAVIGRHHQPLLPDASPLERTLHVARALVDLTLRGQEASVSEGEVAWLAQGRISPADTPGLLERMQDRAQALLDGLQPRD